MTQSTTVYVMTAKSLRDNFVPVTSRHWRELFEGSEEVTLDTDLIRSNRDVCWRANTGWEGVQS